LESIRHMTGPENICGPQKKASHNNRHGRSSQVSVNAPVSKGPDTGLHKWHTGMLAGLFLIALLLSFLQAGTTVAARTSYAEKRYQAARQAYDRLASDRSYRRYRENWLKVINGFRKVYLTYPDDSKVAPKALFMMGRCYGELYGYSRQKADIMHAIQRLQVLVERFPNSMLADDALYTIGILYKKTGNRNAAVKAWKQLLKQYPHGSHTAMARQELKALGIKIPATYRTKSSHKKQAKKTAHARASSRKSSKATRARPGTVEDLRYWSNKDYTRVVIQVSKQVSIQKANVPANKRLHLPRRLVLDLSPARKTNSTKPYIKIQNKLLKSIRIGQYNKDTVRVVLDLDKTDKIKVFYLQEPFRIVADCFGSQYSKRPACRIAKPKKTPSKAGHQPSGKGRGTKLSLAQQLGLCVRKIVIDAGHGGKDPGARGPTGLREKDVVLKIAKKVASRLKHDLNCRVILTRSSDRYLPLTQRTAIANANKADLFVSIHANAARSRKLRGVETYFLNFALDENAMKVAARENATSEKRMGELKSILNDIMKHSKVNESSRLAKKIQASLVSTLRHRYRNIKDHGVKQAPFFVLIGARMPSVLVEVSFISNREEEKRLKSSAYLDTIAAGISKGIERYIRETRMAYAQ